MNSCININNGMLHKFAKQMFIVKVQLRFIVVDKWLINIIQFIYKHYLQRLQMVFMNLYVNLLLLHK